MLKENHGKRIAVIENEFGEIGIDDSLLELGAVRGEDLSSARIAPFLGCPMQAWGHSKRTHDSLKVS